MGCSSIFYKRSLQLFAHALASSDSELAKKMLTETSEKKLEEFILNKKTIYTEKQFFYDAGRTVQCVLSETYEGGCDAFNACAAGVGMFNKFIGIN